MGVHCETCTCHPPKSTGHVDCPQCGYPTAKTLIEGHPLHICELCVRQLRKEEKEQNVINLRDGRGGRHE